MRNSEHLANVMVQAFIDAVNEGIDLVPVVADSTSTAKIAPFIKQFPDRLVNVGIAEQSMVGTAAGLALGGKVAVTCNAAPFLIARANEQIKVDVCYNFTNVKLFGLNRWRARIMRLMTLRLCVVSAIFKSLPRLHRGSAVR